MNQKALLTVVALSSVLISGFTAYGITRYTTPAEQKTPSTAAIATSTDTVKEKIFSSDIISVAEKASPSVVNVVISKELIRYKVNPYDYFFNDPFLEDPFGGGLFGDPFSQRRQRQQQPSPEIEKEKQKIGGGTGFIVTKEGRVITNKHVAADPEAEYTVIFNDGKEFPAKVVSRDPSNDLALLQIQPKDGKMPEQMNPLPLADSSKVKVGQIVIAVGNALGEFENTVTMGVISATGRHITASDSMGQGASELSNLLQTDAAINPGNSGGPLLTLEGEVIGVNTAIAQSANNIGFAIPVNEVRSILTSVDAFGKIVRPYLGVMYRMNSASIAKQFQLPVDYGAIIQDDIQNGTQSVIKDGPADKAGLRSGDIILKINNDIVGKPLALKDLITKYKADETVDVTYMRNGKEMNTKITLGKQEDKTTQGNMNTNTTQEKEGESYLGVQSMHITKELKQKLNLPVEQGALLFNNFEKGIPAVAPDSPAARGGLKNGDIITEIDGEKISENNTLEQIISKKKSNATIQMKILRDGKEEQRSAVLEKKKE